MRTKKDKTEVRRSNILLSLAKNCRFLRIFCFLDCIYSLHVFPHKPRAIITSRLQLLHVVYKIPTCLWVPSENAERTGRHYETEAIFVLTYFRIKQISWMFPPLLLTLLLTGLHARESSEDATPLHAVRSPKRTGITFVQLTQR